MKNRELFKTGSKPAPGELIMVQGFINTLDVEGNTDDIGTRQTLKSWLVRHGLLSATATVSSADLKAALALRESLRSLLLANNGGMMSPASLSHINSLLCQYPLAVSFARDGDLSLVPAAQGMAGALGQIVSRVVKAVNKGTWFRLKACDDPVCQWAFYDNSKNQSGRWCSMAVCGSRDKARAYRRRQSGQRRLPGRRK
ncbi:MAG: CGNR zinc finger domain-containing protein [Candidatus Zixiibacteriota bacterium]|nr:MAG: CGNR zinc finger domain-containing protein [candidate division Zixibacteria bacterium]